MPRFPAIENRIRFGQILLSLAILGLFLPNEGNAKTLQVSPAGNGQIRALVIGIDRYQNVRPLKGAAADARDIASALKGAGVSDLTVLIDQDATRRNVDGAMTHLLEVATPGDLVFLSLAGHGAQAPERVKGSEPDGMDEVFLLSGFASSGRGNTERIIDDEFNGWLSQLNKKGVDVLFVADTCHGGGLTRRPDFAADEQSYRFAGTVQLDQDENTPIASTSDAKVKPGELPHVTFVAAADKYNLVPEVPVPGLSTMRGALSYAVARAVDEGKDGPVTRQQLFGFSRQVAYQYAETRQSIATEPQGDGAKLEQVVFRLKTDGIPVARKQSAPVRLRVVGGDASMLNGIASGDTPFRIVGAGEEADLIWDVGKGEAHSGSGDLIGVCRTATDIPPIVDLVGATNAIAKLTEMNYQNIRLLPTDRRFHQDDVVTFRASDLAKKYLILFDLFGDGTVRFLYPREMGDTPLIADENFNLPLQVGPPFGADHVTAIVSDSRLDNLERSISALDGQKAPGKVVDLLIEVQQSHTDMRVGTAALFTAPH
jgi:Caspase domain/Domain of unknown function (DUF4384)